ncbi:MAG: hypothetical protein WC505_06110 [Patescibacteria group bacterium]
MFKVGDVLKLTDKWVKEREGDKSAARLYRIRVTEMRTARDGVVEVIVTSGDFPYKGTTYGRRDDEWDRYEVDHEYQDDTKDKPKMFKVGDVLKLTEAYVKRNCSHCEVAARAYRVRVTEMHRENSGVEVQVISHDPSDALPRNGTILQRSGSGLEQYEVDHEYHESNTTETKVFKVGDVLKLTDAWVAGHEDDKTGADVYRVRVVTMNPAGDGTVEVVATSGTFPHKGAAFHRRDAEWNRYEVDHEYRDESTESKNKMFKVGDVLKLTAVCVKQDHALHKGAAQALRLRVIEMNAKSVGKAEVISQDDTRHFVSKGHTVNWCGADWNGYEVDHAYREGVAKPPAFPAWDDIRVGDVFRFYNEKSRLNFEHLNGDFKYLKPNDLVKIVKKEVGGFRATHTRNGDSTQFGVTNDTWIRADRFEYMGNEQSTTVACATQPVTEVTQEIIMNVKQVIDTTNTKAIQAVQAGAAQAGAHAAQEVLLAQVKKMCGPHFPDEFFATEVGKALLSMGSAYMLMLATQAVQHPLASQANRVAELALTAATYESAGPLLARGKALIEGTVMGALSGGILTE